METDKMIPVSQPQGMEPAKLDSDVMARAEQLIKLSLARKQHDLELDKLKQILSPYAKLNPIKTPSGQIFYVIGSTTKFISKDKIRQILIEQLKVSEQTADKIIEMGSLDKVINPYIKVIVQ